MAETGKDQAPSRHSTNIYYLIQEKQDRKRERETKSLSLRQSCRQRTSRPTECSSLPTKLWSPRFLEKVGENVREECVDDPETRYRSRNVRVTLFRKSSARSCEVPCGLLHLAARLFWCVFLSAGSQNSLCFLLSAPNFKWKQLSSFSHTSASGDRRRVCVSKDQSQICCCPTSSTWNYASVDGSLCTGGLSKNYKNNHKIQTSRRTGPGSKQQLFLDQQEPKTPKSHVRSQQPCCHMNRKIQHLLKGQEFSRRKRWKNKRTHQRGTDKAASGRGHHMDCEAEKGYNQHQGEVPTDSEPEQDAERSGRQATTTSTPQPWRPWTGLPGRIQENTPPLCPKTVTQEWASPCPAKANGELEAAQLCL